MGVSLKPLSARVNTQQTNMTDHSEMADKCKKYLKFVFWGICLLTICLSIAGISIAHTKIKVAQDLFIVILFFCLLAVFLQGVYKLLKTTGTSKYEISDKKAGGKKKATSTVDKTDSGRLKKRGQGNKAIDAEKGPAEKEEDKWVKNYVPYDEYPAGKADTISVENEGEQKRRVEEKGEKETEEKEEKWKENYVPYEEKSEN